MRHFSLLIVFLSFLLSFAPPAPRSSARVKFLIGKVDVLPYQKTNWKRARMNQAIFSGDRIKTALNARIELNMPDGTVIKVNENSIFDVKSIKTPANDQEDEMSFTLFAGNIWAKFKKLVNSRQSREIESPSAVVAIRGTTLELDMDQNKNTTVRVIEGKVAFRSKDVSGEVLVGTNQQSTVRVGKAPTTPVSTAPTGSNEDLQMRIRTSRLQYTDPAILVSGIPIAGKVTPGAKVFANSIPLAVKPNGVFEGHVQASEGINEIRLVAKLDMRQTSKVLRVLVNTRRPQIRLSQPIVAGFINRRDYSLSGAIFDGTPKDKVKVYINNELVAEVFGRGTFNRTIILNEGKNDIRLSAVDFSKNTIEKAESIFLDTVKPILTVTDPASPVYRYVVGPLRPPSDNPGMNFNNERIVLPIRGIIIDPAPSSGIKRVMVNGKEIKPNSDGSFETEIVLKRGPAGLPGENRLLFYVEDMAGNITRDNSRVIMVYGG